MNRMIPSWSGRGRRPSGGGLSIYRFKHGEIPARVVIADVGMGDWILCEITSRRRQRSGDIEITVGDMEEGSLERASWARPGRLHTLHESLFGQTMGRLTEVKLAEIIKAVQSLF